MKKSIIISIMVSIFFLAPMGWAEPVPSTINYQGYLSRGHGTPLPDGDYPITFRIYETAAGGTPLWTESWSGENAVPLSNGRFSVSLGSLVPFRDKGMIFDRQYYLELQVGTNSPLSPRLEFTSAPYALSAGNVTAMASLSGDVTGTTDVQNLSGKTLSGTAIEDSSLDNSVIGGKKPAAASLTDVSAYGGISVEGTVSGRTAVSEPSEMLYNFIPGSDGIIMVDTSESMKYLILPPPEGNTGNTCSVVLKKNGNNLIITDSRTLSLTLNQEGQAVLLVSDGSAWLPMDETGSATAALNKENISGDTVMTGNFNFLGNECIGVDCVNGESFESGTLKLKENNLRIYFQDTSSQSSFPTNDWRITANDSANGGRNYISIDDVDSDTKALVIDKDRNVGMGTEYNPEGRLDIRSKNFLSSNTFSTKAVAGTGRVSNILNGIGTISSTGTEVTTNWQSFSPGFTITAGGETRTVTKVIDSINVQVDSPWSNDLVNQPFTYTGTFLKGIDTLFYNGLLTGAEITVNGETKKITKLSGNTDLLVDSPWSKPFTDKPYYILKHLTGTSFYKDLKVGDIIYVAGSPMKISDILSDTELVLETICKLPVENKPIEYSKSSLMVTKGGNMGIGTSKPVDKFVIDLSSPDADDPDFRIKRSKNHPQATLFTLKSPSGKTFAIAVGDDGNIETGK